FARAGTTISPVSGREVKKDDVADVTDAIVKMKKDDKVFILVAFKQHARRKAEEELNILLQKGFSRIAIHIPGDSELTVHRIEDLLEMKPAALIKVLGDAAAGKDGG